MEFNIDWIPIFKVFFAMFLGGLMGLEREMAQKPAGLRTHMLVAGASSLLVVLGDLMIANYSSGPVVEAIQSDPIRIIEAIITGISFLGAGTIIFRNQDETVEGLTTAASILFAGAIGITVALQEFIFATILTLIAIVILFGLGYIENFVKRLRSRFYDDNSNQ
ncbi:putative Mg2+ transporter-C (MgtC) family protein [Fodinibius salinus]|uniref:Putative Mg2+ transporter-C (MgtC) family protein n=1 Tax=Fodinibius salinus TaxID=860790 RepID=A0A5D3YP71_9BACT|nr:MgtC/SapB family protein [Fodinibius salinus]TYP93959.1 putative Mg2+ transporter-C (MgtC) family protein [Fodinibius salinus]